MSLFYALSAYSKGASVLPAFILSGCQFSVHRGKFSAKQGKSEFFFGVLWCFLGIFGDNKVQNLNIFLKCRKENRQRCGRLSAFHRVHWSRDRQAFDASGPAGPAGGWLWSSCGVFPAFCPLVCFAIVWLLANMALLVVFSRS